MELHDSGFERLLALIRDTGDSGKQLIDQIAGDEVVGSLLLL